MPYIRCVEEVPYVRALSQIVEKVESANAHPEHSFQLARNGCLLFPGRLAHHYALNRHHFAQEFYVEARIWSIRIEGVMFGWYNVEMHSLNYNERSRL